MRQRMDLTIKNIKKHLVNVVISNILEIGCGTGKNLKNYLMSYN
jgi:hypothetical protein